MWWNWHVWSCSLQNSLHPHTWWGKPVHSRRCQGCNTPWISSSSQEWLLEPQEALKVWLPSKENLSPPLAAPFWLQTPAVFNCMFNLIYLQWGGAGRGTELPGTPEIPALPPPPQAPRAPWHCPGHPNLSSPQQGPTDLSTNKLQNDLFGEYTYLGGRVVSDESAC